MSDAALSVNSNVTIKLIDKYGRITRTIKTHNKANQQMVYGILRFLSGDFNKTNFNDSNDRVFNSDADQYIPVEFSLGTVGVKMVNRDTDKPVLNSIVYSEMKKPTFDEVRLQDEIKLDAFEVYTGGYSLNFDEISLTSFDDSNNSMGLLLRKFVPAGKFVGFNEEDDLGEISRQHFIDNVTGIGPSNGWAYYNEEKQEYEALFTEIGLYTTTLEGRRFLLARVLFDGKATITEGGQVIFDDDNYTNNPVIQSDSSSMLIEWRIGIVSIGQNDKIISAANLGKIGETIGSEDSAATDKRLRTYVQLAEKYYDMYKDGHKSTDHDRVIDPELESYVQIIDKLDKKEGDS